MVVLLQAPKHRLGVQPHQLAVAAHDALGLAPVGEGRQGAGLEGFHGEDRGGQAARLDRRRPTLVDGRRLGPFADGIGY